VTSPTRISSQDLVSLSHLQTMWQHLSSRFFENRLPAIRIEWSSRLTASSGLFVSEIGPRSRWVSAAYRHGDARVIRLSAPLLRGEPEAELLGTLAHEMIHQWEFDIRKRYPSHGPTFREMMDRMNEEGLGITIRHQLNENVAMWNRYAWKCIRCGMAYYRQRRTIVPSRHLCSRCRGALVEVTLEQSQIVKPDILTEPCVEEEMSPPLQSGQLHFNF
jgi:predicted SprT family Zn-dependent metalloprotease